MEEEIINICKKIKDISKCNSCGGSYKLDTCIYCGTKNSELTELISKLDDLIIAFRSQTNLSNIIRLILFLIIYIVYMSLKFLQLINC